MVEKYCQVEGCGRRIITGRKYCYEHRGAISSESYSSLEDYFRKNLLKGYTLKTIKETLEKQGYSKETIEKEAVKFKEEPKKGFFSSLFG